MNKRQKKKREKKVAWDNNYKEYLKAMKSLKENGEGYRDPTAFNAIINAMRKGY